jgi:hypothetical protein
MGDISQSSVKDNDGEVEMAFKYNNSKGIVDNKKQRKESRLHDSFVIRVMENKKKMEE